MGVLLHVWRRDQQTGGLNRAVVDSDAIPDGWVDAPDKVEPWLDAAGRIRPPLHRPDPQAIAPEPAPAPPPVAEQFRGPRHNDGRWRKGTSGRRA